jgi:eukaryotic-like serine/threonine-protein kinase
VTPENVLLSFDGEVKLVDFAIARSAADEAATNLGIVVGRHSYVPPESWGGGQIDCRGDLYALGVVLWEMLTGRRAEETPDPTLADPRQLNPDVAPLLAQIVERVTAAAPEDRFPSADELGAALAGFVPAGSEPRRELADLLGLCFDVGLQRTRLADDVAEAKAFLRRRGLQPAVASAASLAPRMPAPPTAVMVAPASAKRERHVGPWVAATVAAIIATSGIGLLRTHGRTARARASAEPLYPVTPAAAALPAIAPPAAAPLAAADLQPPPAAALAPARAARLPSEPARATVAAHATPPHLEPPRRVVGRTSDAVERAPRNAGADALLDRANGLWERGDTAGAYALARQAVEAGAGAPAHVLLGTLLIGLRNYPAAGGEL